MQRRFLLAVSLIAALVMQQSSQAASPDSSTSGGLVEPLDAATLGSLKNLYKQLIDAENRHDMSAVGLLVWDSPSALFVAKTATPAQGNWAGFWGKNVVVEHLVDLYKAGSFRIDPDYENEKVVGLTQDVAETYAPVKISVAYAGQTPTPKPFLMILDWIRTPDGWRMATDIALPIPSAPAP
jgi:hypothetical protein